MKNEVPTCPKETGSQEDHPCFVFWLDFPRAESRYNAQCQAPLPGELFPQDPHSGLGAYEVPGLHGEAPQVWGRREARVKASDLAQ